MEKPFTFDPENHRVVTNVVKNNNVLIATGAIYAFSLYKYNRRFLRIDGNGVMAGAFAAFSLPAAYAYARFMFSDPMNEAAVMNNNREGRE